MKRTLLSLSLFSCLAFSSLYSENGSHVEPVELFALDESDLDLESDLQDDISSLDKEILASEDMLDANASVPNVSTKITTLQAETPLFSSLEDTSPINLVNDPLIDDFEGVDTQSIADPFFDESEFVEEQVLVSSEKTGIEINLLQVFSASPLIYALLLTLSLSSIAIWLYSMSKLKYQRSVSPTFKAEILDKLQTRNFQEVLAICKDKQSLLTQIIASGVSYHKHGMQAILENMKSEGKRATISSWQRLSLLQDIAIVAPMIGLLGTVLGMFYAFYDLNRSFESIANLFDGFGIAVGTTVAGIGVAILAMILHSIIKFRLVQSLARVENEATALVRVLDDNT
jgi:biopolymer transport protein ExbB